MAAKLSSARAAFVRREWRATHAALAGRDLAAEDHELLAVAAYLLGRDGESTSAWEAAHRAWVARHDIDGAARCGFWLALTHLLRGEVAVGNGWRARTLRMIEGSGGGCAASGLALVIDVMTALQAGDVATARELADEVLAIGRRHGDHDVVALGLLTVGETAIAAGDVTGGGRVFDEVMVALGADDVSPVTAGIVYCAVIEGCMHAFDLGRAAEWTEALRRWCAAQPDLVPFRGQCLVHRSQVLQARGRWAEAVAEADRACGLLADPPHPALGSAHYQRGELYRVAGDFDAADRCYRSAATLGCEPSAGVALLRLQQGRLREAVAVAERMVDPRAARRPTPAMLAAAVEVLVAAGDVERARRAAAELGAVAATAAAPPMLRAAASLAAGRVLLAEGKAREALGPFRDARDVADRLDLRHEAALARLEMADACRALGDRESADAELDAAITALGALGAGPDLERARRLHDGATPVPGGLTDREREVLRLVSAGGTNRDIASELEISAHTVARHLQNIFTKLGVSSRAAATSYAYEHRMLEQHRHEPGVRETGHRNGQD